ncbi:STAS domain-containing protein [Luteipulveratus flavus]|uniref:STAS domain-containing protein n=1 Tax=Luteipulveratus flavus TaxID=3031728 RepID=A0ABT6C961_9MICO|nr:STAS domain-containing protein [Luteipulveratus sp. YIM 133296]MDF8264837.1 STAS domain-containing protein [Luteipulveratus sp. YIM 133296]
MELAVHLEVGPPQVLRVAGPLDITTAHVFAAEVSAASRGGTHPVVLDLRGVDVLGSAGVSELFMAREEHTDHGHRLRILASSGSLAAKVLDLVGLEYEPQ